MKEITKEYLAGKFERTEDGVFFPSSRLLATGVFRYNKRGEPEECSENLVVNQGLDYLLSIGMTGAGSTSPWHIMPYEGNVTVLASWVGATVHTAGVADEWTLYTAATRPVWDQQGVASGGIDSFNSKASFESTTIGQIIRGAALISGSAKSTSSTVLMAASNFSSAKTLDVGEILDIGYGLQLTAVP